MGNRDATCAQPRGQVRDVFAEVAPRFGAISCSSFHQTGRLRTGRPVRHVYSIVLLSGSNKLIGTVARNSEKPVVPEGVCRCMACMAASSSPDLMASAMAIWSFSE